MYRREAAPRLGVAATGWIGRWPRTGSSEAKSQRGRNRSPLAPHAAFLLALVDEQADLTLEEIRARLVERGVQAAVSSIWRFFDRHGISFKKNVHAAQQHRPDVASARQSWKSELQPRFNPKKLVFIDETRPPTWPANASAANATPG